jgi:hypothetical protein
MKKDNNLPAVKKRSKELSSQDKRKKEAIMSKISHPRD